ncbi:MAG: acyltransferase [Pedobacter sp.]|nr:MAG: acyltransferase [Pedobacter sp.]
MKTTHNYFIDFLRFFSSLSVVFFHLNLHNSDKNSLYAKIASYGWLGVPSFFVISGYCIMFSAKSSKSWISFIQKRFFRIFPAFWFSLIVVMIAAVFQKIYTGTNSVPIIPESFIAIPATLTLMTWPLTNIKTVNWAYWSLTCEILFYVTISFSLFLNKKNVLIYLIIFSSISLLCPLQISGSFFFLDHWPAFGLGICIYLYQNKNYSKLCFYFLILLNIVGLIDKNIIKNDPEYIAVTLVVASFILLSLKKELHSNLRPFNKLGNYSYSVYLLHVPIGIIFGQFRSNSLQEMPIFLIMYDITTYLVISFISAIVYNYIEQPAIAYGKKLGTIKIGGV